MTRRAKPLAAVAAMALALVLGAGGCGATAAAPVDPAHPLALRTPSGWSEVPVADPGAPAAPAVSTGPDGPAGSPGEGGGAEVLLRAEPKGGSASLTASVLAGRVAFVEAGVSLAEAGREMRWRDYESEPAEAVEVPGADAGRRVDYRYTCADTGDPCQGTVFVLLRERDAYLVRLSGRDAAGQARAADDVESTLALMA